MRNGTKENVLNVCGCLVKLFTQKIDSSVSSVYSNQNITHPCDVFIMSHSVFGVSMCSSAFSVSKIVDFL